MDARPFATIHGILRCFSSVQSLIEDRNASIRRIGNRRVKPQNEVVSTRTTKFTTLMRAALSPAGINYDETLSTLRFADRAKPGFQPKFESIFDILRRFGRTRSQKKLCERKVFSVYRKICIDKSRLLSKLT